MLGKGILLPFCPLKREMTVFCSLCRTTGEFEKQNIPLGKKPLTAGIIKPREQISSIYSCQLAKYLLTISRVLACEEPFCVPVVWLVLVCVLLLVALLLATTLAFTAAAALHLCP